MRRQVNLISAIVIVVDQFTKLAARQSGVGVLNSGVAFAWLAKYQHIVYFQILLAAAILTLLVFLNFYGRETWRRHWLWAGLFFGGALSNVADRLFRGGVYDWAMIPGLQLVNNLADWAVAIGILGVIIAQMKEQHAT